MQLLDGRIAREHYVSLLKDRISKLSFSPCLVIIQVGMRADSDAFIKAKKAFAQKIGAKEIHVKLDENISQKEILEIIAQYNSDKTVQGIIVQLPLPTHLNPDEIINTIDPKKDTDGLTKNTQYMPATARGIRDLLSFYKINLSDKRVTVVGQSKLVGKPIGDMCEKEGAIVTRCDSKTKDIPEKTKVADVVIIAIGKPRHITREFLSPNQIVIDVGITRQEPMLVGDVDFENVKDIVSAITPVPGGVGQMTVLALFENLIDACYNQNISS